MMLAIKEFLLIIQILLLCGAVYSKSSETDARSTNKEEKRNECDVVPKENVEWILNVMQPDFGWKEHTHRACIVLALNGWKGVSVTIKSQIELQLEIELTKAISRNATSRMHENDLALYIHALIATRKNPNNFHGIDLVSDLLFRVNIQMERQYKVYHGNQRIHPFLVLTLCNCQAVKLRHLEPLMSYVQIRISTRQDIELKALSLKALTCASSIWRNLDHYEQRFEEAIESLIAALLGAQLEDGTFGNPYTTALVVQALVASNTTWDDEDKAFDYLEEQSAIEVNMFKTYYIQMALKAKKVKFVKDLMSVETERITSIPKAPEYRSTSLTYSILLDPDFYHTITITVSEQSMFHDVMKTCAEKYDKFNFTSYLNENKEPVVYSVAGVPNDAEENMFWRLCAYSTDGKGRSFTQSPAKIPVKDFYHFKYWYRNSDCPTK